MVLMHQASTHTTLTFCAGRNAERTAAEVWQAFGAIPGTTAQNSPKTDSAQKTETQAVLEFPQEAPAGFEPAMADLQCS